MEDSNMQLIKQESPQNIQLSAENIKTEEIFVCEGIIKQEPSNDETSINCSIGIGDYNPIPDSDSFEDVIANKNFLSVEIKDDIEGDPLEILPINIKIENPFQVDNSVSSGKNEDQSISMVLNNCSPSKSSAAMKEETMNKIIKKSFKCIQCDYKCSQKSNLTVHVNSIHKGMKPFKCNECDYKCSRKSDLTQHVNSVHKGLKPYNCSQCDYKCSKKSSLTEHINSVHEGIKPFKCNECEYKCSAKSYLTKHVNVIHKGIKPYKCNECDYKFSEKQKLTRHVNGVHKDIKPYNCSQCDYKCSRKDYLSKHMNTGKCC